MAAANERRSLQKRKPSGTLTFSVGWKRGPAPGGSTGLSSRKTSEMQGNQRPGVKPSVELKDYAWESAGHAAPKSEVASTLRDAIVDDDSGSLTSHNRASPCQTLSYHHDSIRTPCPPASGSGSSLSDDEDDDDDESEATRADAEETEISKAIVAGEYQLRIHVIEGMDLVGRDATNVRVAAMNA